MVGNAPGSVVELGAGGDDVDALVLAVLDRRSVVPEPLDAASCDPARATASERADLLDRVALDGDVDVEALFPQEDVAHGSPDEVHSRPRDP